MRYRFSVAPNPKIMHNKFARVADANIYSMRLVGEILFRFTVDGDIQEINTLHGRST